MQPVLCDAAWRFYHLSALDAKCRRRFPAWKSLRALGLPRVLLLFAILLLGSCLFIIFCLGLNLAREIIPENRRLSLSLEGTDDVEVPTGNLHQSKASYHRASFTTAIPMYYINLDKSKERRKIMEESFGLCGRLVRVPAVDAAIFQNVPESEQYLKVAKATAGELALFYSHLKAIKYAYDEGQSTAIIFEDDVSPALVPFWRYTPDELVQMMDDINPTWHVVQLQYGFRNWVLPRWRETPQEFVLKVAPENLTGTVAFLINRVAMRTVLAQYTTPEGELDCVAGRLESFPCVSDWLLFNNLNTFIVTPPMFVQGLFVDTTIVRKNDHSKFQEQSFLDSLRWAMENYERQRMAEAKLPPKANPPRWIVAAEENLFTFLLSRAVKRLNGIHV